MGDVSTTPKGVSIETIGDYDNDTESNTAH